MLLLNSSPSASQSSPALFSRGASEPASERPPPSDEYSWEWGAMPKLSSDAPKMGGSPSASTIRGSSSPTVNTIPLIEPRTPPPAYVGLGRPSGVDPRPTLRAVSDSDSLFGDGGRLVDGDVESGEPIAMEYDGMRRIAFDLSLCGPISSSVDPPEAAKLFAASKISLQRLLEDAPIVHNDKLVIRLDDKHISRADGSPLFDALVACRENTIAQRVSASPQSNTPRSRSSWLWWNRSRSDRASAIGGEDAGEGARRPGLLGPPSAPAGLEMVRIAEWGIMISSMITDSLYRMGCQVGPHLPLFLQRATTSLNARRGSTMLKPCA